MRTRGRHNVVTRGRNRKRNWRRKEFSDIEGDQHVQSSRQIRKGKNGTKLVIR